MQDEAEAHDTSLKNPWLPCVVVEATA